MNFNVNESMIYLQAKFLPYSNDRTLISCGQDYQVRKCLLDGCGLKSTSLITKHDKAVHKIAMQPQMPNSFLTAGEDGAVYSIDTRENDTFCTKFVSLHFIFISILQYFSCGVDEILLTLISLFPDC